MKIRLEKAPGPSRALNFLVLGGVMLLCIVLSEFVAKVLWRAKYNEMLKKELHGYDYVDEDRRLLVPRPGVEITVQDYRDALRGHGKPIGMAYVDGMIREHAMKPDDMILKINPHGFKGPDFQIPKPESVRRILAVGDSCTWGPAWDASSYPRVLERRLNGWRQENGPRFEVINGGVGGYNIESVLKRTDEYLAVDPDLIILYIGWNRTLGRADFRKSEWLYRKLDLYKIYYHLIKNRKNTGLKEDFSARTFYAPANPEMSGYRRCSFSQDMEDLRWFIGRARERNGKVTIVLVTLAGLFDWRVEPDPADVRKGYPIASTDNLYAWALLTKKFNEQLRELARETQSVLVDFERYAYERFVPRGGFFVDSVHPTEEGFTLMGEFFAEELKAILDGPRAGG